MPTPDKKHGNHHDPVEHVFILNDTLFLGEMLFKFEEYDQMFRWVVQPTIVG